MAIDRFQNKDIVVTSKVPVESVLTYSLEDYANLKYDLIKLQMNNYFLSLPTTFE